MTTVERVDRQAVKRAARIRDLRERLAVALCSGHLDLPASAASVPEYGADYLARIAGRMAVLLVEQDEAWTDGEA